MYKTKEDVKCGHSFIQQIPVLYTPRIYSKFRSGCFSMNDKYISYQNDKYISYHIMNLQSENGT